MISLHVIRPFGLSHLPEAKSWLGTPGSPKGHVGKVGGDGDVSKFRTILQCYLA